MPSAPVLIVGAGPTGLAAALFLARLGVAVRLLDAADQPAVTSKALGVNPRTLALLENTGVTARIEAEAEAIEALRINWRGRPLATLRPDWDTLSAAHRMVILPQARTEALLTEALAALGVSPERGRKLVDVNQDTAGLTAAFEDGETLTAPVLFAADGAHSAVRRALGLDFPGDRWSEPWQLADVDLEGPAAHEGWLDFRPDGALLCLPFSGSTFRLFTFSPQPMLDNLPDGWRLRAVRWQSEFRVSHRVIERMAVGRVAFGGDAAHIHSPMGARGMNLGIEDAYVFAACAADFLNGEPGRLEDYHRLRHPVDTRVVANVKRMTDALRNPSPLAHLARRWAPPVVTRVPFLVNAALRVGMGLDHPVRVR